MSDEEHSDYKRRRLQNSCDECRKRKVKCDSAIKFGNICSNCVALKIECTHALPKKKRGPRFRERSIHDTVNAILSTRRRFEIPKDEPQVRQMLVDLATHIKHLEENIERLYKANTLVAQATEARKEDTDLPETYSIDNLAEGLSLVDFNAGNMRFFGGSSNVTLVETAMDIKKIYTGDGDVQDVYSGLKRPEFWTIYPWQKNLFPKHSPLEFPPDDLMHSLINLYFSRLHHLSPVLHRSSFLKSLKQGLHHNDRHFGNLVLAVCALTARLSDDPRVFEQPYSENSIGWNWIKQIQPLNDSFEDLPSIYEIQMFAIYVSFMASTSTPQICWILLSVGVRRIQDIGAHRKHQSNAKPTLETELWRRAFWTMYLMDTFGCTFLGRPQSMVYDSFDADLPSEFDDEYWESEDPGFALAPPPGKPSTMSYWVYFIKLTTILESVLRSIYSINQWSAMGMTRLEWSEKTVAELDSSLNKWIDEIPEYLKWDPNRENDEHFDQSAILYTNYYLTQILVHRPFIPHPGEDLILTFPSLAICCNAARSCLHILEVQRSRNDTLLVFPQSLMAIFNSAIVLIINMWRSRYSSSSIDTSKDLALIHRGANMLHIHERRWLFAGRFADILMQVISISHLGDPKLGQSWSKSSLKHPRNSDNNASSSNTPSSSGHDEVEETDQRRIAGSSRVSASHLHSGLSQQATFSPTIDLPLHSSELGSLPIYEPFDFPSAHDQWLNSLPTTVSTMPNPSASEHLDLPGDPNTVTPISLGVDFENVADDSAANHLDDWTSYMASIDEALQFLNPRI